MSGEQYEKHIVVFLDVLGFKDKIKEAGNDPSKIIGMADLLQAVKQKVEELQEGDSENPHIEVRIFSDTIVLSCLAEGQDTFLSVIPVISLFQAAMAQQGHFLRGCAVAGDHLEIEGIAFGPAIIEAYELEKLAIWPRVIIHPSVWQHVKPTSEGWVKKMAVIPGRDGLTYLNYLQHAFMWTVAAEWKSEYQGEKISFLWSPSLDMFDAHKNAILNIAKDRNVRANAHLLTKYHSLAEDHNMIAERMYEYSSYPVKDGDPVLPTPTHILHAMGAFWAEEFRGKPVKVGDSKEKREKFWKSRMVALSEKRDSFKNSRIILKDAFPYLYLGSNQQS